MRTTKWPPHQHWSILLTLPGKPWPKHMFGSVWLEPVHYRARPEGGVFSLWSSGWGQCGVRPTHRSLPWLCLRVLWETWRFQRGRGHVCDFGLLIPTCGTKDSFVLCKIFFWVHGYIEAEECVRLLELEMNLLGCSGVLNKASECFIVAAKLFSSLCSYL